MLEDIRNENPSVLYFVHYLGLKLMYSHGRDMNDCVNDFRIGNDSSAIFSAGEINVRVHFDKYVSNGDYSAHTKRLVFAYEKFLLKNRDALPGVSIWVHGIVLPTDQNYNPQYSWVSHALSIPSNASRGFSAPAPALHLNPNVCRQQKDCIFCTLLVSHWICYVCDRNGFVFLDMFSEYADGMVTMMPEYSDGTVHIRSYASETKEFVARKICEHLVLTRKSHS